MDSKKVPVLFFVLLCWFAGYAHAQECQILYQTSTGSDSSACQFAQIEFRVTSGGTNFDFNDGELPPGWSSGAGFSVGQEECAAPSLTNDDFYWASTAGANTPFIESSDVDVSNGGRIIFDMQYSVQGGPAPCEGPDAPNEGVSLQYSTDGGANWFEINYWDPSPGTVGTWPFTGAWFTLTEEIPPAAFSPATRFRWIQENSSGRQFDNWGLDNIVITPVLVGDWNFGDGGTAENETQALYSFDTPGTYTVTVNAELPNGNTCTETATVVVYPNPQVGLPADTLFFCQVDGPQDILATETSGLTGITYAWNNPFSGQTDLSNAATLTVDAIIGTLSYEAVITDTTTADRCEGRDTIAVRFFQDPIANLGQDLAFCDLDGAQTLLGRNNSNPPTSVYIWNDLTNGIDSLSTADTLSVSNLSATTTYELIVYGSANNPLGCQERDTLDVRFITPPPLAPLPDSVSFCDGDSLQLISGAAGFHSNQIYYLWNDLTNDSVASETDTLRANIFSATTTYELILTDSATENACQNFDTLTVTFFPNPLRGDQLPDTLQLCDVAIPLDASASSHTADFTYLWNDLTNSNNAIRDSATYLPTNFGAIVDYEVIITDTSTPNACQRRDTVFVPFYTAPVLTPLPEAVSFCDAEGVQSFSVRRPEHGTAVSYQWNDLTNNINDVFVGDTLRAMNFNATTVYEVIATDTTNPALCQSRDTIQVTFYPNPDLAPLPTVADFCDLDGAQTFTVLRPSHTGDFVYRWDDLTNGIPSRSTTPELVANNFSSSTTYTVLVQDNSSPNQCQSRDTIQVRFFTSPTLPSLPTFAQFCDSEGRQAFSLAHPTHTPGFSYQWNDLTTPQPSVSGAATLSANQFSREVEYEGIVTDVRFPIQCQNRLRLTVRFLPNPTLPELPESVSFCTGDGAQTLDAAHPTHIGSFGYRWDDLTDGRNNISAFPRLTADKFGTRTEYQITVTDNNFPNACASRDTVAVTFLESPELTLPPNQTVCSGEIPVTLGPAVINTGRLSYTWNTGATTPNIQVRQPGTYRLTVTLTSSPLGCSATQETRIFFEESPVVGLPPDTLLCAGADFSATLNAYDITHGFQDIVYNWYEETVSGVALSQEAAYQIDGPGTYIVQVINRGNDCQSFDTVEVRTIPQPTFQLIGHSPPVCQDRDTLTVFATNVNNLPVQWTAPDGGIVAYSQDSLSVTVKENGIYQATITNQVGNLVCSTTKAQNVALGILPLDLSSDTAFCASSEGYRLIAKDLSQEGNDVSYAWYLASNPSNILDTRPNITVRAGGLYVVQVRDNARNCIARDTVRLTINPVPGAEITGYSGGTCAAAETLRVEATNVLNYEVSWSGPRITSMSADRLQVRVGESGTYTLTITDPRTGCRGRDAVFVQLGDFPEVNLPSTARVCQGDTVRLDARRPEHLPSYTYRWRDLNTGQTVSNAPIYNALSTQTLEVTVSPVSGCLVRDTVRVTVDARPEAGFAPYPGAFCLGDTLRLTATGGDRYQWNTAENTPTITLIPDQTGTFEFQVLVRFEQSICPAQTAIARVEVLPKPILQLSDTEVSLCQDEIVSISAAHYQNIRYTWTNLETGFLVGQAAEQTFAYGDIRPRPTYDPVRYLVRIQDTQTGCTQADTLRVRFDRKPEARILRNFPERLCQGDSVQLVATGGETYRWSNGATTRRITYPADRLGDQSLIVEVSLENNCPPAFDTVYLSVQPAPTVKILGDDTLQACEGQSITLRATGAPSFLWSNGSRADSLVLMPTGTSVVTVIGTSELGCTASDSRTVTLLPTAQLPPLFVLCPDQDSVALNAASPTRATYLWSNGWRDSVFFATRSGIYSVQITSGTCVYTRSTEVQFLRPAQLTLPQDTLLCFTKNGLPETDARRERHSISGRVFPQNTNETFFFELLTRGDSSERLIDQNRVKDDGSWQAEITQGGEYHLRLRNNFGCVQEDSFAVRDVCQPLLKLPNAFTPSPADGLNDYFTPLIADLDRLHLRIFNRYGQVIFEMIRDRSEGWDGSLSENEGWDGTKSGDALPAGTYLYNVIWQGKDPATGKPIRDTQEGLVYLVR
ncbi:MAG: PKD domain-containing protein [Bernardetiaceae bacterium]